ncbi:MAG: helix-turn-helix domain-containing protein [Catenibacillus sp.]
MSYDHAFGCCRLMYNQTLVYKKDQ